MLLKIPISAFNEPNFYLGIDMAICIGGDFDGQDLPEVEGQSIQKTNNAETGKASLYRLQSIIKGNDHYNFWFSDDMNFSDGVKIAEKIIKNEE
ncbi:hypothetical protein [Acinetobacter sp. ANC 3789]|uniref:hypothetical protein n=1 Tax=Acinetobacter sp. ANC 3789 TaxID=1217714 RepID=UPI0012DB02DE|nr:hypothetical protein [Acinetobacter sp. ANC 3789]